MGEDVDMSTETVDVDTSDVGGTADFGDLGDTVADVPEDVPEDDFSDASDMTDESADNIADDFSEDVSEDIPEDDPIDTDDDEALSEDVSDEIPEDTENAGDAYDELPEDTEDAGEPLTEEADDLSPTELSEDTADGSVDTEDEADSMPEDIPEDTEEVSSEEADEQSSDTDEETPDEIEEQPETIEEQMETLEEQPEEVEEQPEAVEEQPETLEEQPEAVEEQPETVEEQPEEVEEQPEAVEEQPETLDEQPESVEEQPEAVEEQSEAVEEQPEAVDPSDSDAETYQYETAPETLDARNPEKSGEFAYADNEYRERWQEFAKEFSDGTDDTKKWDSMGDVPFRGTNESGDAPKEQPETVAEQPETVDEQPEAQEEQKDEFDRVLDRVMDSDLSTEHKRQVLEDMKAEMLAQQGNSETGDLSDETDSDDGAPIKVLRRDGGSTGYSHHDYEKELVDHDEGVKNWMEVQNAIADDLNRNTAQIMDNPDLTDAERGDLLSQNEAKRQALYNEFEKERSLQESERNEILNKLNNMQSGQTPPVQSNGGEGNRSADSLQPSDSIAADQTGLNRYEMPETAKMVDPDDIDMSDALGMDDPNFWNHHGRTKEEYMDLASNLPTVQERLDRGESLEDLMKDPEVGATANQYFNPEHMIRLSETEEGTPAYTGDGRHRIAAAKELGYRIPAQFENAAPASSDRAASADADLLDWERTSLRPSDEHIVSEMADNGEIEIPAVGTDLKEPERGTLHLPSDSGEFLGERGDSPFRPADREAMDMIRSFGRDSVDYREGRVDFSPFTKHDTPWGPLNCEVEIGHMTDQRQNPSWEFGKRPAGTGHDPNYDLGNFAQADNALLAKFRTVNADATLKDVQDFISSNKLTWHECPDGKTMQLVPTVIHDACRHSGGVSEMKYRMAYGNIELPDE